MNESQIKKQTIKASKWSIITEISVKLITPISNMILARLLLPSSFAAVAIINMVISFADLFTDAGFQKYLIQKEFKDDEHFSNSISVAFFSNLFFSLLILLFIVLFRNNIAVLVGNGKLGNGIAVASLALIMTSFSSIQNAVFKRFFDFKVLFITRICSALIPLIITIPLAIILKSYWAIVLGTLCGKLFEAIFLTIKSKWKPKLFYKFSLFKEMISFSAWTMVESFVVWLTIWIGVFIVGHTMSEYYTGLYTTGINTVNSIMSIVVSSSTSVLFPSLSRLKNNQKEYLNMFFLFQKVVSMFVFPMGIGMLVYQNEITTLLLGNKWKEASVLIGIWGFCYAFSIVFGNLASEVYRSAGKPKLSVLAQILHIVVLIPICYYASKISFVYLSYFRSLSRFEFVFVHIVILKTIFKIPIVEMLKNVTPFIVFSLIMGLLGYSFHLISSNYYFLIFSIIICAIVYVSLLLLYKPTRETMINTKTIFLKGKGAI